MKKLVAIVLTMCMVLVLFAGCSDSSSDNGSEAANGNASSKNGGTNEGGKKEYNDYVKAGIEETVIYDEGGIKITAMSLYETEKTVNMNFKIENETEKEVYFEVVHSIVNGFSTSSAGFDTSYGDDDGFVLTIQKENLEFYGRKYWGTEGIKTISSAMIDFTIDGEEIPLQYTINTGSYDGSAPTFDDSGDKLYEKDGISIIYKEVGKLGSNDAIILMIVNDTDKEFVAESFDGTKVNGVDCGISTRGLVFPHSVTCSYMILNPKYLSAAGIEEAENVSFTLYLSDTVRYQSFEIIENIEIDLTK